MAEDSPWEDNLLERKVESDLKDLRKTLVAFSNSVRPGHVATLLIGEKDDGSVQGVTNPDQLQKTVRSEAERVYPPIVWRSEVYEKEGKKCVRVEIEYSGETPHFGAPAWVRRGSETIKASDELFQRLIDYRSGKVRELAKWVGKEVTIQSTKSHPLEVGHLSIKVRREPTTVKLRDVNAFWVTFDLQAGQISKPIGHLTLSWDDVENRLKVFYEPEIE